jgi:condensation domain-containing protein
MSDERDLAARRARLTPARQALLERRLRNAAAGPAVAEDWSITPRQEPGPAPASFGQRRLFQLAISRPGSLAYNVYYAIGLRGTLDAAVLARSLRAVVERHEALHTRFETQDGEVVAVAAPELIPACLPLIDLGGLPAAAAREAEGLRIVSELAIPRFDLRNGPLLRTALLRAAPQEHSLLVAVHHIVIDGWTLALFTRDLAQAYEAFAAGRWPSWQARPLQSADFAHWQHRRLREGVLAEDLAWWRRHLAGAPAEGISWPSRPQAPGGRATLHLGPDVTRGLKALAQRERVTLFITLLAGLDALLQHCTGQTDLTVGTPIALRGRPEAAGVAGFLLNLLPLRTDLAGDPTFLDLLHRARDTFLGALAHREPPIEWLAEELLPARPAESLPWIRVLFNMPSSDAGHADPVQAGPLAVEPLLTGEMGSEFDWTFYARELAGGIRLDLGVNANLLAPGEPARLLEGFAALLGEITLRPQRRLSELAGAFMAPAGLEV